MDYIAIAVILLSSAADALRDSWMRSEGWWKRHAVKWISFYAPLVYITLYHVERVLWLPLCIVSWIVWRLALRYVGGKEWESMWLRWAKNIWHKIGDAIGR